MEKFTNIDEPRKIASGLMTDDEVERAFMLQATSYVEDKAKPIHRSPYYLGFEIIDKNDANNKMVGIFAYRVNKALFYAPAFFLNGDIKGTELFYVVPEKMFVPLNEAWTERYVDIYSAKDGKSIPENDANAVQRSIDMRWIAFPPYAKYAGIGHKFQSKEEYDAKIQSINHDMDIIKKEAKLMLKASLNSILSDDEGIHKYAHKSPLKEFLSYYGPKGINKIASTLSKDYDFANNIHKVLGDMDTWVPDSFVMPKKASEPKADLVVHYGVFNKNASVSPEEQVSKGYSIEDNRPDDKIKDVLISDWSNLDSIASSGIYHILGTDGRFHSAIVLTNDLYNNVVYCYNSLSNTEPSEVPYFEKNNGCHYIIGIGDEKGHTCNCSPFGKFENIYGIKCMEYKLSDFISSVPEIGKVYCVLDKNKRITPPVKIVKMESDGDYVRCVTIEPNLANEGITDARDCPCNVITSLKSNPFFFIHADRAGEKLSFGPALSLNRRLLEQLAGFDGDIEIVKNNAEYVIKVGSVNSIPHKSRLSAKISLMSKCAMREDTADEILDSVDSNGKARFCVKNASTFMRMDPIPQFTQSRDDNLRVPVQYPESFDVYIREPGPSIPTPRLGDQYNNEGTEVLENKENNNIPFSDVEVMNANQLAEVAKATGKRTLFEHGVIGMLSKTHGAYNIVEDYIPDFRVSLDRKGRIYFLFLWKPEEWHERYDNDELDDLGNLILGAFKQDGEMIMMLYKQSKNRFGNDAASAKSD